MPRRRVEKRAPRRPKTRKRQEELLPGHEEDAGAASQTARDTRRRQEELPPRQPGTRGGGRRSCLPDSPGHSEGAGGAASQTARDTRRRQEELPPRQSGTRRRQEALLLASRTVRDKQGAGGAYGESHPAPRDGDTRRCRAHPPAVLGATDGRDARIALAPRRRAEPPTDTGLEP